MPTTFARSGPWLAALCVWLLACAPASVGPLQRDTPHIDGEIVFWNEFNLYPYPRGSIQEKSCISGALPATEHLAAQKRFGGHWVRVYGQLRPYDSLTEQMGLEKGWKGSPILNYCHGKDVILADRIEMLPRTGR